MNNLSLNIINFNKKKQSEINNIIISYNQNKVPKSYFNDNIWNFSEENFIQKDKIKFYKINFNIKDNGKSLLSKDNFLLLNNIKEYFYLILKDFAFLTVRNYYIAARSFIIFLMNKNIKSFVEIDENIIYEYRELIFLNHGIGSLQAHKFFWFIKSLIDKRKLIQNCFSNKLLKEKSVSQLSLYKRDYSKQTKIIPDATLISIIEKCNNTLLNADEIINIRNDYWNIFNNYNGNAIDKAKAVRKKWIKKYPNIKSSIDFERSVNNIITACFILISIYTGMRIGEILAIKKDCIKKVKTDLYDIYYLRSTTYKYTETAEGVSETNDMRSEWLANGEVNKAVNVVKKLLKEDYKKSEHNNLFLWKGTTKKESYKPIQQGKISESIKQYLESNINHHQFRRTFARLVARSAFGEVDILKEHFKHKTKEITEYYMKGDVDQEFLEFVDHDKDEIKNSILWKELINKAKNELGENYINIIKGKKK